MEECCFEIVEGKDLLRIDHFKRPYQEADNPWDKNTLSVRVSVKAHSFSGSYDADMSTVDFEGFKSGIERLYDDLGGTVSFSGSEGYLDIEITGDGLGHFTAACIAQSDWPVGVKLTFELSFDQTSIMKLVDQLKNVLAKFPVYRD